MNVEVFLVWLVSRKMKRETCQYWKEEPTDEAIMSELERSYAKDWDCVVESKQWVTRYAYVA
jgi:hypothetical protein